jgi:hypothetical protein
MRLGSRKSRHSLGCFRSFPAFIREGDTNDDGICELLAPGDSVAAAACFCFTDSFATQSDRATIVVHVYNSANVPLSVLTEAGEYVKEILGRIDIEMIWVDENSRLHGVGGPPVEHSWADRSTAHVSLAIVRNGERTAPDLTDEALGWTPPGQSERAYVFYDRVEAFGLKNAFRVSDLHIPRIVAYTAEHELGHLLIPPLANTHSDSGIMKARLGPDDIAPTFLDTIGFSVKEGELMRQEIRRRISISLH